MLTYAFGDIHGCADQLKRLLGEIDEHRAGRPRKLVFLGDYMTGVLTARRWSPPFGSFKPPTRRTLPACGATTSR